MTREELTALFHTMTIDEIGNLKRAADEYMSMWFGFDRTQAAKRTPEWIEAASKRLAGQVEPCCECGEDYPRVDLHFGREIYCAKCRVIEAEYAAKRKARTP